MGVGHWHTMTTGRFGAPSLKCRLLSSYGVSNLKHFRHDVIRLYRLGLARQHAALRLRLPLQPYVSQINYNIGVGLRRRHCHQQRHRIPSIASPTLHALNQRRHSGRHSVQLSVTSTWLERALTTHCQAWLRLSICVPEIFKATYVSLKFRFAFILFSTLTGDKAAGVWLALAGRDSLKVLRRGSQLDGFAFSTQLHTLLLSTRAQFINSWRQARVRSRACLCFPLYCMYQP